MTPHKWYATSSWYNYVHSQGYITYLCSNSYTLLQIYHYVVRKSISFRTPELSQHKTRALLLRGLWQLTRHSIHTNSLAYRIAGNCCGTLILRFVAESRNEKLYIFRTILFSSGVRIGISLAQPTVFFLIRHRGKGNGLVSSRLVPPELQLFDVIHFYYR